eukprot:3702980-Rhodomonas_salina.2
MRLALRSLQRPEGPSCSGQAGGCARHRHPLRVSRRTKPSFVVWEIVSSQIREKSHSQPQFGLSGSFLRIFRFPLLFPGFPGRSMYPGTRVPTYLPGYRPPTIVFIFFNCRGVRVPGVPGTRVFLLKIPGVRVEGAEVFQRLGC